ncbi:hypothetical protein C086_01196 [Brucella abortus F6/05-3]|nr:hypothetical protein DK51_212 [Brucella abortus]ENP35271.1 hypothetical protein C088_01164 [Brucella abortus 65/110]ENP41204.1 hypothetical protein C055_01102 [Brucella abortus 78/36]ENQ04076.1 hypothetical protein C031_01159 [Brucella abortus F6/05-2]ENR86023.1 hypothetical protein B996_00953 [Brucella abortus 78/14]ENR88772.1 hypothetical protein C981_01166 [Brucella abortus 78/32]ENR91152.1 hypothetical protein C043_01161 [Brucella abortus 80/101]ENR97198.1 hypothetical protein B973_00
MAVARRAIDGDAGAFQLLAGGIDIVHHIGEVAEIAPAGIGFRVPVIGQFQFRRALRPGAICIGGGCEEDQREAALFVFDAPDFFKAKLVYIKIERLVDVADADHRVQIAHSLFLGCRVLLPVRPLLENARRTDWFAHIIKSDVACRSSSP